MANPEHLQILHKGVSHWNDWRVSDNVVPDLSNGNFTGMELDGANFEGVLIHGAIFNGAKLKNAKFAAAKLVGSSFAAANLPNADFTFAQLDYVSFLCASVTSANFSRSELAFTAFANTNMTGATNLETCLHLAPSSIDLNTLRRSGSLPHKFLRGCGLPEKFISKIRVYLDQADNLPSCFISHSTKDERFAQLLYSKMLGADLSVFYAPEDLQGGKKLHEQIFEAIEKHDRLLIVLSENSIHSEWVLTEIRKAYKAERKQKRRKLFPIRLIDYAKLADWELLDTDSGKDLAEEVRGYFIPDFSKWEDQKAFEKAFERLINDLQSDDNIA